MGSSGHGSGQIGIPLVTASVEDWLTPSVCFDGQGRPHLACVFDEPERPVKYCPPDGGGWETVDYAARGGASIAYDPVGDRLLLVFMDEAGAIRAHERPVTRNGAWARGDGR